MASLKSYISSLLSSYRDSHKSVLSGSIIDATASITGLGMSNRKSYTAPQDGVLVIQCKSPCDAICLRQGSNLDFGRFLAESTYAWPVGFIPLRKGATCYFYVDGSNTTTPVTANLRFYPYVGS